MYNLTVLLFVYLVSVTVTSGQQTYPLRSSEKRKGAIYVFTDPRSCFTCNLTLKSVSKIAKSRNIPLVIFLCGLDEARGAEYAARELPDYGEVVYDELGAHTRIYNVKSLPLLMVLGRSGTLYYTGVPGKSSFDLDTLQAAITKVSDEVYEDVRFLVRGVRKTEIDGHIYDLDSAGSIGTAAGTSCQVDNISGSCVVYNHSTRNVTVLDLFGTVVKSQQLTFKNPYYVPSTPMLAGIEPGADTLVFWDTDRLTARAYLARYTITGSFVDTIPLPEENNRISYRASYSKHDSIITLTRRITDGYSNYIVDDGFGFVRPNKNSKWIAIGKFNDYFYDSTGSSWAWGGIVPCGDKIATYQNFDTNIVLFTIYGSPVYRIKVELPMALLSCIAPAGDSQADSLFLNKVKSEYALKFRTHNLLYDSKEQRLYLVLIVKRGQIVGEQDPQYFREYQPIVVEFDLSSRKQIAVVQFPLNTYVHMVSGGILNGITERNKVLKHFRLSAHELR